MWVKATWKKRGKKIKGSYYYCWSRDIFYVQLDKVEPITGQLIKTEVFGDSPEWSGWKLVETKGRKKRINH
jgi:hypothetical protein